MYLLLVESADQTLRSPIATFVLLLGIVLITPPIFERLKLPGLVGLLFAGIIFGGSGLGWLRSDTETMKLLSEIGKIYLMFVAGLEIDLAQFHKTRNRSLSFGFLTFAIPMIGGIAVGLLFQLGWLASVLIGSLLASHTLLAYPIIQKFGVVGDEAITITVGATIFTDIGSLLVLAICLGINQGNFTAIKLLTLLGALTLYTFAILVGLKRFGRFFFYKTGKDEGNQFLFVMLSVFLSAVVAQLIGVENIIGAFLAGLAINSIIGDGPVKEKTEFLGSVLFIPMFFINMGLLLDLKAFSSIFASIQLPLVVVSTLLTTKMLASLCTKYLFSYSWPQFWAMWSLSIPQVAATLAAALVSYEANIINIQVFNSVILMMLLTSILGPLVTSRFARQLAVQKTFDPNLSFDWLPLPSNSPELFSVVVPVYNPKTEQFLIELAALISCYENGRIIPLAIALAQPQMNAPQLEKALSYCQHRLTAAVSFNKSIGAHMQPKLRIDGNVAQAISHVGREENANLIVLGMGKRTRLNDRWFNSIQYAVMCAAHCPVVVAQLLVSPLYLQNILVPIKDPNPVILRTLRFAQILASANQGQITLLHICSPRSPEKERARIKMQMERLIDQLPAVECRIKTLLLEAELPISAIAQISKDYDLVILRLLYRRLGNGLNLGTHTTPLLERLKVSTILVSEPNKIFHDRLATSNPTQELSASCQ